MTKVLVTGIYGFIGSNLGRMILQETDWELIGLDVETYAARPKWFLDLVQTHRTQTGKFWETLSTDISNKNRVDEVIKDLKPDIVIHLAAESHVCRSIDGPRKFMTTNIMGTFNLLEAIRKYSPTTLFHHVSTDEVYGELQFGEKDLFNESRAYAPRSPYAASKASSDHIVQAYHHTYGLNTRLTNCSNNFGPNQHKEKLIPKTILSILTGEPVTLYGSGCQIRDWIWVNDHCRGILAAIMYGAPGCKYLLGGDCEKSNFDVVNEVYNAVAEIYDAEGNALPELKIIHTNERPTDDKRYAIDCSQAKQDLAWSPNPKAFDQRLIETVRWYKERIQS